MSLRMRLYFGLFFVAIIASLFGPMIATARRVVAALNDPTVVRYQQFITADGLASRLYFLASEYRQLGLTPYGTEKTKIRCPFACDEHVYNHPGECVCGMGLVPKYKRT